MSSCSVIMVSYHTGPALFAAVKSVLRQKQLAELILVDNGNPPSVLSRLQQMALTEPKLVVMTGGGNIGCAKACNNAAAHATGDYLLFLRPSALLPSDALTGLMQAFKHHPEARLAGGRLVNPDGSDAGVENLNVLTPRRLLGIERHSTPVPGDTDEAYEVSAVSGACMCIKTHDFRALGGMDEAYFITGEDRDLCLRVQREGGKILHVPRVRVTRLFSTSPNKTPWFTAWNEALARFEYFSGHYRGKLGFAGLTAIQAVVLARFAWQVSVASLRDCLRPHAGIRYGRATKRVMALAAGLADLPEKRDWQGKTVLVTGATGQVGLCIIKRLIASGAAVLALSRDPSIAFDHPHLRWVRADPAARDLGIGDYVVDVVVHCAPLQLLPPMIDALANAEARRVIAFGSTSLFTKAMSNNSYEADLADSFAKAEREIASRCQMRGIQWTVFRPTLIYGVGLDKNVSTLATIIRRFGFFPLYPPAFGRRQPVHADDLAIAVMQAANNAITFGKAYNLSGGKILTYREMVEEIFDVLGKTPRIFYTTLLPFIFEAVARLLKTNQLNGEIARRMNEDLVFFHDDATKDFGFNPRPFMSAGMRDIEGF